MTGLLPKQGLMACNFERIFWLYDCTSITQQKLYKRKQGHSLRFFIFVSQPSLYEKTRSICRFVFVSFFLLPVRHWTACIVNAKHGEVPEILLYVYCNLFILCRYIYTFSRKEYLFLFYILKCNEQVIRVNDKAACL